MYILAVKMIHPIVFSIPEEKICTCAPVKDKLLSSLIPGRRSTYIYMTEHDYYNEYKRSYFAMTTKKGGWDCMRHYEILANGCVPYFPDIEKCPPNTMALFPKELTIQGNSLYNKIKSYSNVGFIWRHCSGLFEMCYAAWVKNYIWDKVS